MDFSLGHTGQRAHAGGGADAARQRREREDLIEALEVSFLANRDERLHFGLLTDFRDARQESLAADGPLLELARRRSTSSTRSTATAGAATSSSSSIARGCGIRTTASGWAYERKRGKLAA
ncbi:MAG: hypothetical protein V5B38_08175 [Candidatus Accumulibacter propinquus]|jgi:cyclic beta-1,2-glucan synthetase